MQHMNFLMSTWRLDNVLLQLSHNSTERLLSLPNDCKEQHFTGCRPCPCGITVHVLWLEHPLTKTCPGQGDVSHYRTITRQSSWTLGVKCASALVMHDWIKKKSPFLRTIFSKDFIFFFFKRNIYCIYLQKETWRKCLRQGTWCETFTSTLVNKGNTCF